ncbi:MAG: hypothetical protein AB8B96_06220 [Lysobacterales bacterium]
MLRKLAAGLVLLAAVGQALAEENLYSLLDKHLDARGGYDAWKAIDTVRMIGEMSFSDGQSVPVVMEIRRPNLLRFEFQLSGQQIVQGYDGTEGWRLISDGITRELEDMDPEQAMEFSRTADFDGPLMDWREKAYSLRYLGVVADAEAGGHLIEVTRPGGDRLNLFLGEGQYLTRQEQLFRSETPDSPHQSTVVDDYREVAGVLLPFRYDINLHANGPRRQLVLDSVDLNVPLAASRFARPAQ